MDEQELTDIVLKKTNEAYSVIGSLGDENGEMLSYFRELHNFYTHFRYREVYLRDFKEFYFGDIEENILRNENELKYYDDEEKTFKKHYIANAVGCAGFLAGAIISKIWPLAIPALFFVRDIIRIYNRSNELKKEKQSALEELEKAKEKKKEIDEKPELLEKMLERVLDKNKNELMEYHRMAMEESNQ